MTDTMEPVKEINLNDLKARLDKAVEVLGKVVPILRNEKVNPITTEDIVEAEALLWRESKVLEPLLIDRLVNVVCSLEKVIATWQSRGIKAKDVADAIQLIKKEKDLNA